MLLRCFLIILLIQSVNSSNLKFKIADFGECKSIQVSPEKDKIAFTWWDKSHEVYDKLYVFHINDSVLTEMSKYSVSNYKWLSENILSYYISPILWINERKTKLHPSEYGPFIFDFKQNQAIPDPESEIKPIEDVEKEFVNAEIEKKIQSFIEANYKSHPGTLGGTVKYDVKKYLVSPDKNKILFLVIGDDGHAFFNPTLYLTDKNFTKILPQNDSNKTTSLTFEWISDKKFIMFQNEFLQIIDIEN